MQAVLGTLRRIGLDRLLPEGPKRLRQLAEALNVARVIEPAAKLATARALDVETASHSLGHHLKLGTVRVNEIYAALGRLGEAQPRIEAGLARRHPASGTLVLYDVTSTWLEGRCCPLGRFGDSRDGRRDKLQIIIGLLCAADGCPIAVEVFDGNTSDPATLASQIAKLKQRFGLERVVLVGDRGMITSARIEKELRPAGLDWITELRAPAIRRLAGEAGPLQLSLFDERDLAEIESPDRAGERLIVCRNPVLAEERRRNRNALLDLTERDLLGIRDRGRASAYCCATPPRSAGRSAPPSPGAKVGKHFEVTITDDALRFHRDEPAMVHLGAGCGQPALLVGGHASRPRVGEPWACLGGIGLTA